MAHGVVEAGLNGSFGNAGMPRDFLDLEVLVVSENDDFAMVRGKVLNGLGETGRAETLVQVIGRAGLNRFFECFPEDHAFLFPAMPAAEVQENAMKPGVNGGISAKTMGRFEGLHEGFLDQVLRFGFVAAQQTS